MNHSRQLLSRGVWVLVLLGIFGSALPVSKAYGAVTTQVSSRYDQLSTGTPGVVAVNTVGFIPTDTADPIGSIEVEFCSNSPLYDDNCIPPTGLDASKANLVSQTGNTGFVVASNTTTNAVVLTRSPSAPSAIPSTYTLGNISNPSALGTYYARIYTYSTTDASGPLLQYGGIALSTTQSITVRSEVPPYLRFCAGIVITNFNCNSAMAYTVNLGNLSTHNVRTGISQFTTATNAQSGFTVQVSGTTLTSGNNVISTPASPTPSIIGTDQFGINLRANSGIGVGQDPVGPGVGVVSPGYDVPNQFMYNDGDIIASSSTPSNDQTFTVSYIANISATQPPGVYSTTITFVCVGNF